MIGLFMKRVQVLKILANVPKLTLQVLITHLNKYMYNDILYEILGVYCKLKAMFKRFFKEIKLF